MSEIKITESSLRRGNVSYLYCALLEMINRTDARVDLKNGRNRYELKILVPDGYKEILTAETEDKMADVIAVNYKYNYFKRNVKVGGLNKEQKELLLVALISADLDEDKKYIIRKLRAFNEYSIDGIFNFRMKPLKEKWAEIISYIPTEFGAQSLKDFISYLIKDKVGKKVYYENGKIYDKHYNELKLTELLGEKDEISNVKEIILSGAGEVEIVTNLTDVEAKYLKDFYGDKIVLASENYS